MLMPNDKWTVEVDQASASEWSEMLDQFSDANIYQTAAYGAVRWGEANLSRLVLKRDGEVVAIAQFRIIRPTPLKFGMAYLRWGPLWEMNARPVDEEVVRRFARTIEDEYLVRRKLLVRILPNAFVGSTRAAMLQAAFPTFTEERGNGAEVYRTFVLDLTPSLEELRSGLDKKWRNQLTRSEKSNLAVTCSDDDEHYRSFCEMYRQMHARKGFATKVDIEEFGRMQALLPASQRMRVLICRENEVPVAGLVASAVGESAIYLLGATSDAGLNARGAYLLQWTLISWLKERGIRYYDLGGIDPNANPGVFHFKKGLSGADICQIGALCASKSALSSGLVKAGLLIQRTLAGAQTSLKSMRSDAMAAPGARA